MAIPFPPYRPTSWELQLPNYRVITNSWRATEWPEILGSLPEDARLRLRYENITDAEALELLLLWRATAGGYYPLNTLPAEVAAGIDDVALANRILSIAPLSWVVAGPPRQESVKRLRSGVDIELKSELRFVPSIVVPTVTCPVYIQREAVGCFAPPPPPAPGPEPVPASDDISAFAFDMAHDSLSSNQVYVVGSARRERGLSPIGDPSGFSDPIVIKYNVDARSITWQTRIRINSTTIGGIPLEGGEASSVDVDNAGNVYTSGRAINPAGGAAPRAFFIAKLNTLGAILWQKVIAVSDNTGRMAVDGSGNAYITMPRPGDTGSGSLNFNRFVKLDTSGNLVWALDVPYSSLGQITVDKQANRVYLAGITSHFVPGLSEFPRAAIVACYSTAGDFLWQFPVGTTGAQGGIAHDDICVDESGNIYTLGGSLRNPAANGLLMIKHDPLFGDLQWDRAITAAGDTSNGLAFGSITADSSGNVYATTSVAAEVHRLDAGGTLQWSKSLNTLPAQFAQESIYASDVLEDGRYCLAATMRSPATNINKIVVAALQPDGSTDSTVVRQPYAYAPITSSLAVGGITQSGMPFLTGQGNPLLELEPVPLAITLYDGDFVAEGGNITIDIELPTVSIAGPVSRTELNTGTRTFPFAVTRSGGSLLVTTTVNWAVTGTGGANSANTTDFVGGAFPSGTVTFNPTVAAQTINVSVQGDMTIEEDEEFFVTLSNPINAIIGTGQATGIILNEDFPAPADLSAVAVAGPAVSLSWSAVAGAEGYQVQWSDDGVNYSTVVTIAAPTTTYLDTEVEPETTYWYRVAARRLDSNPSTYSAPVSVTTGATPIPPASSAISATYAQSSVYVDNVAATQAGMQNDVSAELLETGTDAGSLEWVRMDFGTAQSFSTVVVGCDFDNTLAGGWGRTYTEDCLVEGSNDASAWTTLFNTGTFSQGRKAYAVPGSNYRYARIRPNIPNSHLAVTEFYAVP